VQSLKIVKVQYAESSPVPQYYVNGCVQSSWLIAALFNAITISFLLPAHGGSRSEAPHSWAINCYLELNYGCQPHKSPHSWTVKSKLTCSQIFFCVYICMNGQSSWLQIWRPGFDSLHYQKKKVVGLERGPLSLVSTTEELLDGKVAAPV
jgi:hypothetical protein